MSIISNMSDKVQLVEAMWKIYPSATNVTVEDYDGPNAYDTYVVNIEFVRPIIPEDPTPKLPSWWQTDTEMPDEKVSSIEVIVDFYVLLDVEGIQYDENEDTVWKSVD